MKEVMTLKKITLIVATAACIVFPFNAFGASANKDAVASVNVVVDPHRPADSGGEDAVSDGSGVVDVDPPLLNFKSAQEPAAAIAGKIQSAGPDLEDVVAGVGRNAARAVVDAEPHASVVMVIVLVAVDPGEVDRRVVVQE